MLALARKYKVYVHDLLFFGGSIIDRSERSPEFQAKCGKGSKETRCGEVPWWGWAMVGWLGSRWLRCTRTWLSLWCSLALLWPWPSPSVMQPLRGLGSSPGQIIRFQILFRVSKYFLTLPPSSYLGSLISFTNIIWRYIILYHIYCLFPSCSIYCLFHMDIHSFFYLFSKLKLFIKILWSF